MSNRTLLSGCLGLALVVGEVGCGGDFCGGTLCPEESQEPAGAHITQAFTTLAAQGEGANGVSTFRVTDSPIYCLVEVAGAPAGTRVGVSWALVQSNDPGYRPQTIDSRQVALERDSNGAPWHVRFSLTHTQPFPAGAYRVGLYLDGGLARSLSFSMR